MKRFFQVVAVFLILSVAFQASAVQRFKNADKDKADREFLELCQSGSDAEIIKALKNGANPHAKDERGKSVLDYVAPKRGAKVIRALFDAGLNHYEGDYADVVGKAAGSNPDPDVLDILINVKEYRRNAHARTSPLHAAAKSNNHKVVERLIKLGFSADINTAGGEDRAQPLIIAAMYNKDPMLIEALINAGAEDTTGDRGWRALMWAAYMNNTDALKTLIGAGSDVNFVARDGETALSSAVRVFLHGRDWGGGGGEFSNLEAIKLLINAGADPNRYKGNARSLLKQAKSELWHANSWGKGDICKECIAILEKAGAK